MGIGSGNDPDYFPLAARPHILLRDAFLLLVLFSFCFLTLFLYLLFLTLVLNLLAAFVSHWFRPFLSASQGKFLSRLFFALYLPDYILFFGGAVCQVR